MTGVQTCALPISTDDTTDDTHAMLQAQMILQAQAIYRLRRSTNTDDLQAQAIYRHRRSTDIGDTIGDI